MKLGMCIGSNVYNMHVHHLGRYLEGQGHSMTLKKNRIRPVPLFFEVRIKNDFTEMIAMSGRRVARNIWVATLKVKVTA